MSQQLLFAPQDAPQGLIFERDFISEKEEGELLGFVRELPFKEFSMHGVIARRRVVHFGRQYSFASRSVAAATPLPPPLALLAQRAATLAEVGPREFVQALVNEYRPGAGIGWHVDAPPFGIVAGISLSAPCRMRFERDSGDARQTFSLDLPPRSIYLLTGEIRSDWEHAISPMKDLRYSITFRTLRPGNR